MFDICPPSVEDQPFQSIEDFPKNSNCTIFDDPFSLEEFHSIIKKFKIKSSPGLDQFDYHIISSLPSLYLDFLLSILNGLLDEGLFPQSWSQSLVFLIPKTVPGKFRPISLTSCFLKTLEKLILNR